MDTLTLKIDNPAIIPSLRKVLSAIDGVVILPQRRSKSKTADVPNATTLKAIKDVKEGRTFKASSVDDLMHQCLD